MRKQVRAGIIGNHIVLRDVATQQEMAFKKITSPTLMKDWMRTIEKQKDCIVNNINWEDKTGKHWIYL